MKKTSLAKRSRSRTSTTKTKAGRPLSQWNMAMQAATKLLRAQNADLKGADLFRQGAALAHELIAAGKFGCSAVKQTA